MEKSSKKVIGEISKYEVMNETSRLNVSYWNLVRSYILLHYSDKIVAFYATGMGDNNDFLHCANLLVFSSEDELNTFYDTHKDGEEGDFDKPLLIRSVNGNILD